MQQAIYYELVMPVMVLGILKIMQVVELTAQLLALIQEKDLEAVSFSMLMLTMKMEAYFMPKQV